METDRIMRNCKVHGLCEWKVCETKPVRFRCIQCRRIDTKKYKDRLKIKALEYKGGSCNRCGYSKCIQALEFHHTEPHEKDFGFSGFAHRFPWAKVLAELDKCLLLCSNCHKEEHYGMKTAPSAAIHRPQKVEPCKHCGKDSFDGHKYCSMPCYNLHRTKIDWKVIDLVSMRKIKSVAEMAKVLGVTERTIRDRLVIEKASRNTLLAE